MVTALLVGAAGLLTVLLNQPSPAAAAPTITITSAYHVGATLAGATGTTLRVSGQGFAANTTITLLLDGSPAPGAPPTRSASSGAFQASLAVTAAWPIGQHRLSARDAAGHTTPNPVAVRVVAQGEALTPGPNNAPADSQSFTLVLTVHPRDAVTGEALPGYQTYLVITGKPDPAGGAVCNPLYDNNRTVTQTGTSSGINFTITSSYTCSGTYKGGKLSYTETTTSYQIVYATGLRCQAKTPYVNQAFSGSFTSATTLSGTFRADAISYQCSNGQTVQAHPKTGTWTGTPGG